MSLKVQKVLLLMASTLGIATALDCISCTWSAKNDTLEHKCLGAPYKLESEACPEQQPGVRYACQTHAVFTTKDGHKNLATLERSCSTKHSKCNNACLDKTVNCWLCCDDSDKCNSFPLRASIQIVSSAPSLWQRHVSQAFTLVVVATAWSFRSLMC